MTATFFSWPQILTFLLSLILCLFALLYSWDFDASFMIPRLNQSEEPSLILNKFVCWNGTSPDLKAVQEYNKTLFIFVSGEGCQQCRIWELCTFRVVFDTLEAYFPPKVLINADLGVDIKGPALISPRIEPFKVVESDPLEKAFDVRYTPYLPGNYNVTVLARFGRVKENKIFAEFSLFVSDFPEISEDLKISRDFGHWVRNDSARYNYTFHELPGRPIISSVNESISALINKNVSVITFLGDSHIRELYRVIEYTHTGNVTNKGKFRGNGVLNITSIKGDSNLTIFNHWLAGIYKVGECHAEGLGSKKLFDRRSEFVVFDLGSWELQVCKYSFVTLATHLPEFFSLLKNQSGPNTKIILRSITPFPGLTDFKYSQKRREGNLRWLNGILKSVSLAYGIHFLDLWHVENPMRLAVTKPGDIHYSLNGQGEVGEVVAKIVLQLLAELA